MSTSKAKMLTIDRLPVDCLLVLFHFLSTSDLVNVSMTCTKFYNLLVCARGVFRLLDFRCFDRRTIHIPCERRMDQYHQHEVPKPQILRENKEFWTTEGNVKIRKTGPILYQCQWWRSWGIHNKRIEWYKHRLLWSPDSPPIIKGLFDREAQFNDGRTSCTWQGCK